ncbi:DUF3540 domain-containing protein [Variovorax sp. OV700]|uniref:DUF3540 domain-containing protein n=1 Tax=Variovorax sp. OV700 TaxID=1882826 RepID=UPI00088B6B36|nr:DUF3540 domain-containing protein [Variovorax sp. OV700]SDJ15061.1 Protein of unknown function [Variovorax sp. OV700]
MGSPEKKLMQLCAAPMHGVGTVLAVDAERRCRVVTAQGELSVSPAASCLLAPEAGDVVWLCGDFAQGMYVTAVLERGSTGPAGRVVLPAGAVLESADGTMTLKADHLTLAGEQLAVQGRAAAIAIDKVTGIGREVTWSFGRVKVIADLLESFADRVSQFSRWSQRTVAGMDQVRATQVDYRAEQMMQLHADNLVANAANLVKLDGEQIHMG